MALPLCYKNQDRGSYYGKATCHVCGNTYDWEERLNAEIIVPRAGRLDGPVEYLEFIVYSKCNHKDCNHTNKHTFEFKR